MMVQRQLNEVEQVTTNQISRIPLSWSVGRFSWISFPILLDVHLHFEIENIGPISISQHPIQQVEIKIRYQFLPGDGQLHALQERLLQPRGQLHQQHGQLEAQPSAAPPCLARRLGAAGGDGLGHRGCRGLSEFRGGAGLRIQLGEANSQTVAGHCWAVMMYIWALLGSFFDDFPIFCGLFLRG